MLSIDDLLNTSSDEIETYLLTETQENVRATLNILDHYYHKICENVTYKKTGNFMMECISFDSFMTKNQKDKFDHLVYKLNIHKKVTMSNNIALVSDYYVNYKKMHDVVFSSMVSTIVPFHDTKVLLKYTSYFGQTSHQLFRTEQSATPIFGEDLHATYKFDKVHIGNYEYSKIENIHCVLNRIKCHDIIN